MIVYLATYPRCGSAVLRSTVRLNWRYMTANFYGVGRRSDQLKIGATDDPAVLTYQLPEGPVRRMLVSPCRSLMTPELRSRLAADPELFFIKTHDRPPEAPFPGEVAVQLVRHPGAAICSHWQLALNKESGARPIADYIDGKVFAGRWDHYHGAWASSEIPLLRRRFEDILAGPAKIIGEIAEFLGLPVPESPLLLDAKRAHERSPIRNPLKGVDGWRNEVSTEELTRIWELHGTTARDMGYALTGVATSHATGGN